MRAPWLALFVVLSGCSRSEPDAKPDGVVRLWLDRMEVSTEDPRVAREAYELLGPAARANLEERAHRVAQLQGRHVEPYEMLAEGRFGLRFRPKAMRAIVVGDRATVEVVGNDSQSEHAAVRCVREHGGWRVEPDLPELASSPARER